MREAEVVSTGWKPITVVQKIQQTFPLGTVNGLQAPSPVPLVSRENGECRVSVWRSQGKQTNQSIDHQVKAPIHAKHPPAATFAWPQKTIAKTPTNQGRCLRTSSPGLSSEPGKTTPRLPGLTWGWNERGGGKKTLRLAHRLMPNIK